MRSGEQGQWCFAGYKGGKEPSTNDVVGNVFGRSLRVVSDDQAPVAGSASW